MLIRKYLAGNKRRGESFLTGSQTRTVAVSLQNPEDMHRALQILEIIDCILQHARESSVKVAPLARVCKTFSGPALDSTWRVLHKPLPLLKLFSGLEMDTVREPYFYVVVYRLTSDILPSEWERFLSYCHRVREITCGEYAMFTQSVVVHSSVWQQLFVRNGGRPLLPHVRIIDWYPQSLLDADILYLTSPTLRQLRVDIEEAPSHALLTDAMARYTNLQMAFGMVLQQVVQMSPFLEVLDTSGVGYSALALPVSVCSRLRVCKTHMCISRDEDSHLDIACLDALAASSQLEELAFDVIVVPATLISCTYAFNALRKLTVQGDIQSLERLLAVLTLPCICLLNLQTGSDPQLKEKAMILQQYHALFSAISAKAAHSLTSLEVSPATDLDVDEYSESEICFSLQDFVAPLFQLKKLEALNLTLRTSLTVSPVDVQIMAKNWPGLKSLCLEPCSRRSSIDSLVPFAKSLPLLRILLLHNFRIGGLHDLEACPASSHELQTIKIFSCGYEAYNPADMAHMIDRLFPNIVVTDSHFGLWRETKRLLAELQAARAREGPLPE